MTLKIRFSRPNATPATYGVRAFTPADRGGYFSLAGDRHFLAFVISAALVDNNLNDYLVSA